MKTFDDEDSTIWSTIQLETIEFVIRYLEKKFTRK